MSEKVWGYVVAVLMGALLCCFVVSAVRALNVTHRAPETVPCKCAKCCDMSEKGATFSDTEGT